MADPATPSDPKTDPYRTRPTLIARVLLRDEAGWAEFYAVYSPLILWLCARRGLRGAEASQLVVQAVMRHFATTDWNLDPAKGRFRNLVLKVAQLKAYEVARELRPRVPGIAAPFEEADVLEAHGQGETEEHDARLELVHRAMRTLAADPAVNPRHLWIFGLFLDGAKVPEICALSGESTANLHVIKHRMIGRIKAAIEAEETP